MSNLNRAQVKEKLTKTEFDAVVIGGGISGAWIALYLAQLDYSVALLERNDFGSETSSASSKLLHGGIRYLQQLELTKVRESSLERAEYLAAAPHLAHAVPFLVPTYKGLMKSKLALKCAMFLYSALGTGQHKKLKSCGLHFPDSAFLSKKDLLNICEISDHKLTGALRFPEFQMHDSERTVWSILSSAINSGALIANYAEAKSLLVSDKTITGVCAKFEEDAESVTIKSKLVINAAGPWIDNVIQSIQTPTPPETQQKNTTAAIKSNQTEKSIIHGYATGTHLITRQLVSGHAIAVTTQQQSNAKVDRGGRHIFIVPWRNHSLIGTSYRETSNPDDAKTLQQEDIDQLLETINDALPSAHLAANDIISSYSGLYPLRVERIKEGVYQGSGEYLILDHKNHDDLDGIITSLGAKFTTARVLAQKTADLCVHKLNKISLTSSRDITKALRDKKLHCAQYGNLDKFQAACCRRYSESFDSDQIKHFIQCYGSGIHDFIEYVNINNNKYDQLLSDRIIAEQPDIYGQVAWAVNREHAYHLDDVLLRRTSIAHLGIRKCDIETIASLMRAQLGWTDETTQNEISIAERRIDTIRVSVLSYFCNKADSVEISK